MPAEVEEVNIFAKIAGEKPLPTGADDGPQFLPDWAKVIRRGDRIQVMISGPILNSKGQPYKVKRGLSLFDMQDQGDESTPAYVLELLIMARDA